MTRYIISGIIVLGTLLVLSGSAFADYSTSLKAGNQSYNASQYDDAIGHYIKAIQAAPEKSGAYRNLARCHFWKENYAAAVAFYDDYLFLQKEPDDAVQAERKLASERAGDEIYKLPTNQLMANRALSKQLTDGVAYSRGGGGAFGLYQVLIRTKFASPELIEMRKRLAGKIFDEFEAYLLPEVGQVAPSLDLAGWQLQAERLNSARQLYREELFTSRINQRSSAVEVALSLLTGSWNDANQLLTVAINDNPDLTYLRWFEVLAHLKRNDDASAKLSISKLARVTKSEHPTMLDYVRVLRAVALQRSGNAKDSMEIFLEILRR